MLSTPSGYAHDPDPKRIEPANQLPVTRSKLGWPFDVQSLHHRKDATLSGT